MQVAQVLACVGLLLGAPVVHASQIAVSVPEGFAALPEVAFAGSSALLPSATPETGQRRLLFAFAEPAPGGASLAVGRVELPLTTGPQGRVAVTSAVARHLRAELGVDASVERSSLVVGPSGPRLDVRAHVRGARGPRALRFSFLPAGDSYFVVALSAPAERSAEIERRLDEWMNGLRLDLGPIRKPAAALNVAVVGAIGAGAAVALRLWMRSRRRACD